MIPKPRFLLSRKKLLEQYSIASEMADIVAYSFKTNPEVGKELERLTDCMFAVHSQDYFELINDKSRAIFFTQGLDAEDIENLLKQGVRYYVVDNENDLKTLLASIRGYHINLFLRLKLKEHTIHTGKHFVYGMSSEQVNRLIPELRKNKSIDKLGIHFHRKTMNIGEWNLVEEINDSLGNILEHLDFINIGGGLPVKYKNYPTDNLPAIIKNIKSLRSFLNKKNIRMIIEPGRFLAAPCIKLEAYITNIYDNNIIINCSVYNAAMDTFAANTRLEVEGEKNEGESYTIKGCTPDSLDIFRYKVFLENPKIGDKITFLNAGAYNYATEFCNLKKIRTECID